MNCVDNSKTNVSASIGCREIIIPELLAGYLPVSGRDEAGHTRVWIIDRLGRSPWEGFPKEVLATSRNVDKSKVLAQPNGAGSRPPDIGRARDTTQPPILELPKHNYASPSTVSIMPRTSLI